MMSKLPSETLKNELSNQFVAFIWGAAQMVVHTRVKPKSISDYDIADMLSPDYHFFSCIKVNMIYTNLLLGGVSQYEIIEINIMLKMF